MYWDSAANEKLLLAILEKHDVKLDYEALGGVFGCSASAVSQHIQKLKRQVKSGAGNGEGSASAARKAGGSGENDDEGEAPAKKRRTKAATPRKPRAPANKKGKAQEPEDMEAENLAAGVKRGRSEGDKAGTVEVKNKEADVA